MLQKLDAEHLNRLALAEALASMEPRDFDMRRPNRCICGHALRKRLRKLGVPTPTSSGRDLRRKPMTPRLSPRRWPNPAYF